MVISTRFKFTALLVSCLGLLALGSSLFTTFSVSDTLSDSMSENSRNTVFLAANTVQGKYGEFFKVKVALALQVKDLLRLYERIILGLDGSRGDWRVILDNLALHEGLAIWVMDDKLNPLLTRGSIPRGYNPYEGKDIKGRDVGENMLRLAKQGTSATALVQLSTPDGKGHQFFGTHFYLATRGLLVGVWADLEPSRAVQARSLEDTITALQENFSKIRLGQSGFLVVADASGKPVVGAEGWDMEMNLGAAHPESGGTLMDRIRRGADHPEEPVTALLSGPSGTREALLHVEYNRPLKWYVIGVSFVDEIRAPGRRLSLVLALGILAVACVLVLVAFVLIGKLTGPLARLARFARQLPATDFFGEIEDNNPLLTLSEGRRGDEIEQLSKALLFMDGALRARVRELVETAGSRERMAGELQAATEIQMGFLPKAAPDQAVGGRCSLAASLIPAREVGGDLYDFFMIDDNRLCLVIGDVSDKGVPAALFMSMTMVLLRASGVGAPTPEKILAAVNENLCRENPNSMFVTMFVAFLDLRNGVMSYVNAGHNPPLVRDRNGGLRQLDQLGGPVAGAFENIAYASFTERLLPGETLFMYTDGLTEAMNSRYELFGDERLRQILSAAATTRPEAILSLVRSAVENHVADAPASDDLTMLCLDYIGPPRRNPH